MSFSKDRVDYLVYLVTDDDLLPSDATLENHVAEAVRGGASIIQLREKNCDTGEFIERASRLLRTTRSLGVPLVINDRVDVALAVGADGVHVGQDDMDCRLVRKMLGPDVIVGVSVTTVAETERAYNDGADYIGIGSVFATNTKKLKKPTMGPAGVREILTYLSTLPRKMFAVAIGGINETNAARLQFQSQIEQGDKLYGLDGFAVVSAIIASTQPQEAAARLRHTLQVPPPYAVPRMAEITRTKSEDYLSSVKGALRSIRGTRPLLHHITNNVVKNFSANVSLAIGGAPIMSEAKEEASDLAEAGNALILNMGTISSSDGIMLTAAREYLSRGKTIVFDPVGAGASAYRRSASKKFLNDAHFTVIKGNEGEICTVAGEAGLMRGVDSQSSLSSADRVRIAKALAIRERKPCGVAISCLYIKEQPLS